MRGRSEGRRVKLRTGREATEEREGETEGGEGENGERGVREGKSWR